MAEKNQERVGKEIALDFMFTLDTNILIYYASGDKPITKFLLENLEKGVKMFLPTIAVAEFLSYPALTLKDRQLFSLLLDQLSLSELDFRIAVSAADLRRRYKMKLGDSVIAATAVSTNSTIVTRNLRDFRKIPYLKVLAL